MLFQSQGFILVFLPSLLLAFYAVVGWPAGRQWVLIAGSMFFYAWWDVRFLPLLLGQISATWILALIGARLGSRLPLVVGIVLNLASLITFKYLDFLLGSIEAATSITLPRAGFVLPVGISFFSFQLISYLVDRLRRDAPIYPFRPFLLFVLLFPHLIAGPIVRHHELIPQFELDPRRAGGAYRFGVGFVLFTIGLAKKVLLADALAEIVDNLFMREQIQALNFGEAWTAALGFALQLFLDFSAYTEMAIGIALMFGLLLPENFRRPYLATDLRDFWRRWHITLSNFIRDYLYIPFGGSRKGPARTVVAVLASMGLCGLWHGAGWTYAVWGLWHGGGLLACRAWQRVGRPLPGGLGWLLTMGFVLVGWVVFRSPDFTTAASILGSLSGYRGMRGTIGSPKLIAAAAAIATLLPSAYEMKDQWLRPQPVVAIATALLAIYCVLVVGVGGPKPFIYFQF